jgi:hypothetical protein
MPSYGVTPGPVFNIYDAKVAVWNGDGTWGTNIDVPGVRVLRSRIVTINGRAEGDGRIIEAHAEGSHIEGTLQFINGNYDLYAMIANHTKTATGSTPTRYERIKFTPKAFRYFAICGRARTTDGVGDEHIFMPKCKVMEGFEIGFAQGEFKQPELSFVGLADDYYKVSGTSEVQTITITGTPTGGTFTLTFAGATTSAIAYNASAATVQTALEALSTIGSGNVLCAGGALPGAAVTATFWHPGSDPAAVVSKCFLGARHPSPLCNGAK